MLAIGAGGLDIACAMAGAPFTLAMPKVIGIHLTGALQPMCSAKDVILELLRRCTVKNGVGKVFEYYGDGVASLSVPQRATITNMGAELGVTTSIFPSDQVTKEWLALQKREGWQELAADDGAQYDEIIDIDLTKIEPMIAQPHMPDLVVPVREIEGKKIVQAAIGSCTNSSINDLGIAADILDGKTVAPGVSLGVSPGSKQVYTSAIEAGIIKKLVKSGARMLESACGPCIGMGFAPASGGASVRTFNRNFKGRSGTATAEIYLASPETAAASALFGCITDPRKVKVKFTDYSAKTEINDNMIEKPAPESDFDSIEIIRGPNIKPCPKATPAPASFTAEVLIKTGDNITTDHIMPAGTRVLPYRSNIPEIAKFVFEAVSPGFYDRAKKAGTGVIIGGENYGQGSSREHAALAPMYLGVKAVITKSFARIHKANLINFGIVPLVFENPADYDILEEGMSLSFPSFMADIKKGNRVKAVDAKSGREFFFLHDLEKKGVDLIEAGGMLNYIFNTRK